MLNSQDHDEFGPSGHFVWCWRCWLNCAYWENFAVELILRLRQTVKFDKQMKAFMRQWSMNMCVYVHTSRDKHPIDDYSWQLQCYAQQYLALSGRRLDTKNTPSARPYCNCQPLKADLTNCENLNSTKVFDQTWKFSDLQYIFGWDTAQQKNTCFLEINDCLVAWI